jgi:hypothetical protein
MENGGGGRSQFRRLEKTPSSLSTLCSVPSTLSPNVGQPLTATQSKGILRVWKGNFNFRITVHGLYRLVDHGSEP